MNNFLSYFFPKSYEIQKNSQSPQAQISLKVRERDLPLGVYLPGSHDERYRREMKEKAATPPSPPKVVVKKHPTLIQGGGSTEDQYKAWIASRNNPPVSRVDVSDPRRKSSSFELHFIIPGGGERNLSFLSKLEAVLTEIHEAPQKAKGAPFSESAKPSNGNVDTPETPPIAEEERPTMENLIKEFPEHTHNMNGFVHLLSQGEITNVNLKLPITTKTDDSPKVVVRCRKFEPEKGLTILGKDGNAERYLLR